MGKGDWCSCGWFGRVLDVSLLRIYCCIDSDETPEVEATPKINGGTRRDIYMPQYRIGNPPCMILCSSKTYSSEMIIDANDIQNSSDP